ncbi:hypothetical protein N7471_013671 [Penicillium samsonianum]|uniref:uncharacterized protein n=1 Tax=Penicillium samsonianum TaxID=1882272 RepID=UPI0025491083|nr:uncharacterized protein N7471_013671 [Penicillium samsonianum]KAJ6118204.1 hypothetical protein N7471_013671 [Penicillium samsonianum]
MKSQLPGHRAAKKPPPTPRRPSPISKATHPATPPERVTRHHNVQEEFLISTTYSTIAARALSFQGQVLTGVPPLQLAQNGFYYEPRVGDLACCFACQSAKRLAIFKSTPIEEVQQLHIADCIWQVLYLDLKQHLETPDAFPHPITASPSPRESTPSRHFSSDRKQLETSAADSSIHPQPTYASVFQHPTTSPPQSTPKTHEPVSPTKLTLTIEDLHRRFHNKTPPYQFENKTRKCPANRIRHKPASATESLSNFLSSALPAFSRFLTEMQPKGWIARYLGGVDMGDEESASRAGGSC